MGANELTVEGSAGALEEHLLSLVALEGDGHALDALDGQGRGLAHGLDEDLGVHSLLHEGLDLGRIIVRRRRGGGDVRLCGGWGG